MATLRRIGPIALAGIALSAFTPGSAQAEARSAQEPLAAVARLNHAGYRDRRHCTAFAIAPRVIATAAHCLDGRRPGRTRVLFGFERMAWQALAVPTASHTVGNDVGVLCLGQDAPETLPRGTAPAPAAKVVTPGYGQPTHLLQKRQDCTVLQNHARGLVLDCPLSPGHSGAPVLTEAGEAVAIVSRTSPTASLAVTLPPDLADLCPP